MVCGCGGGGGGSERTGLYGHVLSCSGWVEERESRTICGGFISSHVGSEFISKIMEFDHEVVRSCSTRILATRMNLIYLDSYLYLLYAGYLFILLLQQIDILNSQHMSKKCVQKLANACI